MVWSKINLLFALWPCIHKLGTYVDNSTLSCLKFFYCIYKNTPQKNELEKCNTQRGVRAPRADPHWVLGMLAPSAKPTSTSAQFAKPTSASAKFAKPTSTSSQFAKSTSTSAQFTKPKWKSAQFAKPTWTSAQFAIPTWTSCAISQMLHQMCLQCCQPLSRTLTSMTIWTALVRTAVSLKSMMTLHTTTTLPSETSKLIWRSMVWNWR